ncbi:MAG: GLUG motif-containing protein [Acidimicrobiia bacterium]
MLRSRTVRRRLAEGLAVTVIAATALFIGPAALADPACSAAGSFAGGSGTSADPYKIATADQLSILTSDDSTWSNHYVLTADIDLASCTWNPVGTETTPFTGSIDGAGFSISNLLVDYPTARIVGLFGLIYAPGDVVVDNLHLVDVDVRGEGQVGAIAGINGAIITRSSASGTVTGGEVVNMNGLVGGLVGENGHRIGDVRFPGLISYSLSRVDVVGIGGRFVGGLVGYNRQNSAIIDSYARGTVTATTSDETFSPVTATAGFAGYNGINSTIDRGYTTAPTTSNGTELGGFLGRNDTASSPAGEVRTSFWDTQTTGQATSAGGTGETTASMTTIGTFESASWAIVAGWAPFVATSSVWGICPAVNDGYPYLLWEYEVTPCAAPAPVGPSFTG